MRPTPLPSGVLLSHTRWRGLGVSSQRLAGPELIQAFPGFYTPRADPATLNALCFVLQNHVVPGAVISHTTAAVLLGMPVPSWADRGIGLLPPYGDAPRTDGLFCSVDPASEPSARRLPILHARMPGTGRRGTGPGVVLHRKTVDSTVRRGRLVVSDPIVVLMELATLFDHDEVVIAIDHLLGPGSACPGLTIGGMREALERRAGSQGARSALRALADARPGVESPGETRTRLLLVRAGFPEPIPNFRVRDPDGGGERRIDNAYPGLLLGAEYDGDVHRDKQAWRADQRRQDSLASIGWDLRRLTAADIARPAAFLGGMRRSFLRAGADAPPESNWKGRDAEQALARPRRHPTRPRRRGTTKR